MDFYVGHENNVFLWAEAKRGVKRDIYEQFVQLILTIGKNRRFNELEAPDYLGAFIRVIRRSLTNSNYKTNI